MSYKKYCSVFEGDDSTKSYLQLDIQAWNFIFERESPFSFDKKGLSLEILQVRETFERGTMAKPRGSRGHRPRVIPAQDGNMKILLI